MRNPAHATTIDTLPNPRRDLRPQESIQTIDTRVCILILGMHRSGTSALTRVLSLLGAELPKNLYPDNTGNELGHWEPDRLIRAHERLLAAVGSRWDDWREFPLSDAAAHLTEFRRELSSFFDEEFPDSKLMVVKEPRICRFPSLYTTALAEKHIDVRFIIPLRNPVSVIKSLERRNGITAGYASLLWLRHVLDAEHETRGFPRAFLSYETLMSDWVTAIKDLEKKLGIRWPRPVQDNRASIEQFLRPDLQHHTTTLDALDAQKKLTPWVRNAYRALLVLEKTPDDAAALGTLARIRPEFELASKTFGEAAYTELEARDRFARHAHGEAIANLIAAHKKAIEALSSRHSKAQDEIRRLASSTRTVQTDLESLQQLLASERNRSASSESSLRLAKARLDEKNTALRAERVKLAAAEDQLSSICASTSWRITRPLRALSRLLADARAFVDSRIGRARP